jgi:hypothetical protein
MILPYKTQTLKDSVIILLAGELFVILMKYLCLHSLRKPFLGLVCTSGTFFFFFKIYYCTECDVCAGNGARVAPPNKFIMAAMLILLMIWNKKVERWGGLLWHYVLTRFNVNLSLGSRGMDTQT